MKKDEIQLAGEQQQNLEIAQDAELEDVVGGFEVRSAQLIGDQAAVAPDIIICVSGC